MPGWRQVAVRPRDLGLAVQARLLSARRSVGMIVRLGLAVWVRGLGLAVG